MKKLALILAFMLIPCSAFGLQMLDDTTMDGITGQSGVSIAFDDVQMFLNIEKLAWIDCDGLTSTSVFISSNQVGTCSGAAGAIGLNNFQMDVININAIISSTVDDGDGTQTSDTTAMQLYSTNCGQIPLFYDYGQTSIGDCYLNDASATNTDGLDHYYDDGAVGFQSRLLSIDVTDAMPAITAGINSNGSTVSLGGVVIGIPTMEIYIQSMSLTPFYTGDVNGLTSTAINNNKTFGTIYLEGITFTTLSGWLEIGPH